MKIDDIKAQWEQDCPIDPSELGRESLKIPVLHNRYLVMLMHEKSVLKSHQIKYDELLRLKFEYYTGKLDEETLAQMKWSPMNFRLLKSDVELYLNADRDLNDIKLRMALQQEKVDFLQSVIQNINSRNFLIKNAIDWAKFQNGVM